jgi:hypothetical protein
VIKFGYDKVEYFKELALLNRLIGMFVGVLRGCGSITSFMNDP